MITAHLPAGYLLSQSWPIRSRAVTATALVASALPDADLIWFYFIDQRAFHHHHYWVHIPGVWVIGAALVLPGLWRFKRSLLPLAAVFFAAIFLHLVLDSLAGSVAWLWPFSDELYALVTVPPTRSHWILSFVAHWTFAAELVIWAAAFALFLGQRRAV